MLICTWQVAIQSLIHVLGEAKGGKAAAETARNGIYGKDEANKKTDETEPNCPSASTAPFPEVTPGPTPSAAWFRGVDYDDDSEVDPRFCEYDSTQTLSTAI